ncbi:hypothetical protein THASP1DRAFT_33073, partial [Thamnocephalis sphaerospora]
MDIALEAVDVVQQAAGEAYNATRTTTDINFINAHKQLQLVRLTRHCSTGQCVGAVPFCVAPDTTETFTFDADSTRFTLNGCMISRISRATLTGDAPAVKENTQASGEDANEAKENANEKDEAEEEEDEEDEYADAEGNQQTREHLYLLVAWKIRLKGTNQAFVDLVSASELDVPQWNNELLKRFYEEHVRDRFTSAHGEVHTRSWQLENTSPFSVDLTFNNKRQGQVDITLKTAERSIDQSARPFQMVQSNNYSDIIWDPVDHLYADPRPQHSSMTSCSVELFIHNNSRRVELSDGEQDTFCGAWETELQHSVPPGGVSRTKLVCASTFEDVKGCVVYQIQHTQRDRPLLWGRYVFLVVDMRSAKTSERRRMYAGLVVTKNPRFARTHQAIERLHSDLAERRMLSFGKPSIWRLDQLDITLRTAFQPDAHA